MAAERLGSQLIDEIKEESLDEVCILIGARGAAIPDGSQVYTQYKQKCVAKWLTDLFFLFQKPVSQ